MIMAMNLIKMSIKIINVSVDLKTVLVFISSDDRQKFKDLEKSTMTSNSELNEIFSIILSSKNKILLIINPLIILVARNFVSERVI